MEMKKAKFFNKKLYEKSNSYSSNTNGNKENSYNTIMEGNESLIIL